MKTITEDPSDELFTYSDEKPKKARPPLIKCVGMKNREMGMRRSMQESCPVLCPNINSI